jgi:hypothetical protein
LRVACSSSTYPVIVRPYPNGVFIYDCAKQQRTF